MKSEQDIQFFLHLGYFPDYKPDILLDVPNICVSEGDEVFLIDKAAQLFREAIGDSFSTGRHVVPLSGGLDSRAILAALMELVPAEMLKTYTFGTPGTYDFDIGCMVAEAAGTKHTAIALDDYGWQESDFVEAARRNDYQTMLFHHPPVKIIDQFADGVVWSGYIGDLVTGGHLNARPSLSLEGAKKRYLENRSIIHSMNIISRATGDFSGLIGNHILPFGNLSFDEQVMFSEVGCITAPHVLMKGFEYRTPFINNSFYEFFLNLPPELRFKQYLFKKMVIKHFPHLFQLPCKNAYGLPLQSSGAAQFARRVRNKVWNLGREHLRFVDFPALPMTNYFDVDLMLRQNKKFAAFVYNHLQDLKRRAAVPWIDIEDIWMSHMSRKAHHGDVIKMLFSLEINLKGGA